MRGRFDYKRENHGKTNTRLYRTWCNMRHRCGNPNRKDYKYYGGRGVKVCDEWLKSFTSFYDWAMHNGYSDSLTLDRIDVNKNYEPSNCRWVDMKTQMNNRTVNCYITINGERKTAAEWSEISGKDGKLISERIRKAKDPITAVFAKDLRKNNTNEKDRIKVVDMANKRIYSSMTVSGLHEGVANGTICHRCKSKTTWMKYDEFKERYRLTDQQIEEQYIFVA